MWLDRVREDLRGRATTADALAICPVNLSNLEGTHLACGGAVPGAIDALCLIYTTTKYTKGLSANSRIDCWRE